MRTCVMHNVDKACAALQDVGRLTQVRNLARLLSGVRKRMHQHEVLSNAHTML